MLGMCVAGGETQLAWLCKVVSNFDTDVSSSSAVASATLTASLHCAAHVIFRGPQTNLQILGACGRCQPAAR